MSIGPRMPGPFWERPQSNHPAGDCSCMGCRQLREKSAEILEELDAYLVEVNEIVHARHFSPSAKLAAIEKALFPYFNEIPDQEAGATTPDTGKKEQ